MPVVPASAMLLEAREGISVGVFYAQIRFRESGEWLTVARAESRRSALEYATAAYRESRDGAGRPPVEMRVLIRQAAVTAGDAGRSRT
jgi:uncharacterized protein YqjF (DUF2071 family)